VIFVVELYADIVFAFVDNQNKTKQNKTKQKFQSSQLSAPPTGST